MGGSSTYCVGVSDDQTWEACLAGILGTNNEVLNFGIPGSTSIESSIQTALLFSDVQPDVALFYLGWNDARVQHVLNLRPDWADFQGKWMTTFGLSGRDFNESCAAAYMVKRAAFRYFCPGMDPEKVASAAAGDAGNLTGKIDERALSLYVRNLGNITALCRHQNARPVFVPQVMNYGALTNETAYGWLPFVRDKDLKKVIGAYNDALEKFAEHFHAGFIREVLEPEYGAADFLDQGHFSPSGNKKFAEALAAGLRRVLATPAHGYASHGK
jgi:lysophospholipase L1-like esterase